MGSRPQTIGPYALDKRLGAGGMGEVYQAYDARLDRWVAIKLTRPESSEDSTARERFRREARAAAHLSHPAIVQIHDIVETDEGDAIVMELVEGESLASRIKRGPLPVEEAVRLGREIAEGLAAAHARGIIHRDLKPENVMITADGRAKILDFGLAKRLEGEASLTEDHRVVGTFRSMSPEQARGLPLDHRSDLFSFGVLLYEMLSGQSPFDGGSALETLTRICTHRQTSLRELDRTLPEELSSLVDHLLEKDPLLRPRTASEVARALEALRSGEGAPRLDRETLIDGPTAVGRRLALHPDHTLSGTLGDAPVREGPRWAVVAILVSLLTAVLLWQVRSPSSGVGERKPSRPIPMISVAVPRPEIGEGARPEMIEILASGLQISLLRGLLAFENVVILAPEQVDEVSGSPVELARILGVEEVLTSRLDCRRELCQVLLSRIRGRDGRLLWTQSLSVAVDQPHSLASAVQGHLAAAYPHQRVRPGLSAPEVRPEDYAEYLRLRHAFETRQEGDLFARLEEIRTSSPRFVDAYLFESEVRQQSYKSSQDPEDLERAWDLLRQAYALAPADPRPLAGEFGVAMIRGDLKAAERAVAALERLQPGDPLTLINRARLFEKQGRMEEALELMREGVRRLPSRRNLSRAAQMGYRLGRFDEARRHLEELLRRNPESYDGLTLLAQVELLHGDTRRAVELYSRLVERSPEAVELTNLGVAQLFLRQYRDAEESFRKVLDRQPDHLFALLNLADAVHLQDRREEAADLYRQVLHLAAADPETADPQIVSVRAQALAHLGDGTGAVEAVQRMLRLTPEEPQITYEASLVYTLLGDRNAALFNAKRALELGVAPKLFELIWFDPLRSEPVFQKALQIRSLRASS